MYATQSESSKHNLLLALTYLPNLNMGVFYGVGVTFDELFHLPQVGLLNFLKLLQRQGDNKFTKTCMYAQATANKTE